MNQPDPSKINLDKVKAKQADLQIAKKLLKELSLYIIFLISLYVTVLWKPVEDIYNFKHNLERVLTETKFERTLPENLKGINKNIMNTFENIAKTKITFKDITNLADSWDYILKGFFSVVYESDQWYNGRGISEKSSRFFVLGQNILLGDVQLRQVKVRNGTCHMNEDVRSEVKTCYGPFTSNNEMTDSIEKRIESVEGTEKISFAYTKPQRKFDNYKGSFAEYHTGGYIYNLRTSKRLISTTKHAPDKSKFAIWQQLLILKKLKWIDEATRAVFIEMILYNGNLNKFAFIRLVIEYPEIGGARPSYTIRVHHFAENNYKDMLNGFHVIFLGLLIYYAVLEIIEFFTSTMSVYFSKFWNWIDLTITLATFPSIFFLIILSYKINTLSFTKTLNLNSELWKLQIWSDSYDGCLALIVYLSTIRLFKYMTFSKTLIELQVTLSSCYKDLIGFLVMFIAVQMAYVLLGHMVFGPKYEAFGTMMDSMMSLLLIIIGEYDYDSMEDANPIIAALYFFSYQFLVVYVLLNMLLAIVIDTYSEVKSRRNLKQSGSKYWLLLWSLFKDTLMNAKCIEKFRKIFHGKDADDGSSAYELLKQKGIRNLGKSSKEADILLEKLEEYLKTILSEYNFRMYQKRSKKNLSKTQRFQIALENIYDHEVMEAERMKTLCPRDYIVSLSKDSIRLEELVKTIEAKLIATEQRLQRLSI